MRRQDQVLLELRAYLVLTPEISKEQLLDFVKAIKCPSFNANVKIENIFYSIATAGGTRQFKNPIEFELITIETNPKIIDLKKLSTIYSPNKEEYLSTSPIANASIIFGLPPFLKVQVESYQIGSPKNNGPKKGGIQSWLLQGLNDINTFSKTIDQVSNDKQLDDECKIVKYQASNPNAGFFRYLRLQNTGVNHLGNQQLILRDFDISGKLIISKE